jgi:hypothetical protein
MGLQISGVCHYHPSRPGIGVCVECREVVCAECTTQFEGINRCAACLSKMGKRPETQARGSDFQLGSLLTLTLVFALLFGGISLAAAMLSP